MNRTGAPNYFLKCYIVMLVIMVITMAIFGMIAFLNPYSTLSLPLDGRVKGFIFAVFAPAMISLAFTVFHFERRVTT